MEHHEYTPEEIKRIEDHTHRVMQEREERKARYRLSRRERIAAEKPEWTDCADEEDVVCPYCGNWQPGDTLPLQELQPRLHEGRNFEVRCGSCKQSFGCRAAVNYSFTTFKPEDE